MRFLAPLIAAVALSGCSNNDKTQKPTATPLIPKAAEANSGKPPVVPESAEDPVKQACACNHKHCGGNPEKKNEMGKMPPVIPGPAQAINNTVANETAVVIPQTQAANNTEANETAVVIPQQQPVNVIAATLTTNVAQPQAVVIVANQTTNAAQPQAINTAVANETTVVSVSAATVPVIGENTSGIVSASAQAENNIVPDNVNGPIISPIAIQPVDPQASASAANIPTPVNTAIVNETNSPLLVVTEVVSSTPGSSNSLIPDQGINTEQFDASLVRAARLRYLIPPIKPSQPAATNGTETSV